MRTLYLLILAAAVTACASEAPQKAATATPPAAPVKVAAQAPAAAPASAANPAAAPAANGGFIAPAGYQKKTRGSATVYCKSDTPVGTRFPKEYCYTQGELEQMDASRGNIKQEVERARRTCTGGGCGGG